MVYRLRQRTRTSRHRTTTAFWLRDRRFVRPSSRFAIVRVMTLGGSLASCFRWCDLAGPLVALDAHVVLETVDGLRSLDDKSGTASCSPG